MLNFFTAILTAGELLSGCMSMAANASPSPKSETVVSKSAGTASGKGSVSRTLPPGIAAQSVEEGRLIFHSRGQCVQCHGQNGAGTFLAPALNDDRRIHLRTASYEEILERIRTGVPQAKRHPIAMPPLGGASLNEDEVRAVAAFVFSIDRGP